MTRLYTHGSVANRFQARILKTANVISNLVSGDCWVWQDDSVRSYPQMKVGNKIISPSVVSWKLYRGDIPKGEKIIRRCNNVFCVNPQHLILGNVSLLRSKLYIGDDGKYYRRCHHCHEVFEVSSVYFNLDKSSPSGYSRRCKECDIVLSRETKIRHWQSYLISQSRNNAKDRGLDFDFCMEDVDNLYNLQRGRCYWFGVVLEISMEYKNPFYPSLDRLDILRGYTRDNVVLSCVCANFARNSSSMDSFKRLILSLSESIPNAPFRLVERKI